MNEDARPVVAFLDTNALHLIHLYLTRAEEQNLYPFAPGEGASTEAKEQLRELRDDSLKRSLEQGLDIVACLSSPDVRVEYSPISELELMAGRARGRAIENAAKEGIPDRMWTRFSEREISRRLTTEDLASIRTRVEGLGPALEKAGILATVSDPDRTRDVLDLAKGIAGLVYLSLADSVIYASTLVARADCLITRDDYFRKTVNCIRNGRGSYDEVKQKLRILIEQITLERPDDVTLPEAKRTL